jgi:hypothetical protein
MEIKAHSFPHRFVSEKQIQDAARGLRESGVRRLEGRHRERLYEAMSFRGWPDTNRIPENRIHPPLVGHRQPQRGANQKTDDLITLDRHGLDH